MKYVIRSTTDNSVNEAFDASDDEALVDSVRDLLADDIEALFTVDNPPARGYFPDPVGICNELYARVRSRLNEIDGRYALMRQDDSSVVELRPILGKIVDIRESGEGADIDVGYYIISMLRSFLDHGRWHYGLMCQDGVVLEDPKQWPVPQAKDNTVSWLLNGVDLNPVLWFGLDGEPMIEYWTIDKKDGRFERVPYIEGYDIEFWKSCWFNHFWTFDWNVLLDHAEGLITWMFAECGMEEPEVEFDRVKNNCPIALDENDSAAVLLKKIDSLFLKKVTVGNAKS